MPKHEAHCCDISVRIRSHNQNGLNNREGFPVPLNDKKKWREGQSESKASKEDAHGTNRTSAMTATYSSPISARSRDIPFAISSNEPSD